MATDLCPHGEHPAVCMECLEGPPPERARSRPGGMDCRGQGYITAQYEGFCPVCEEDVLIGEKIVDFDGRWGHLACASLA